MSKPAVIVATSEKTWQKSKRYLFNKPFFDCRNAFHLTIVCNGYDDRASQFFKQLEPEFLFIKPNTGYDLALFDYGIKNIPLAQWYIFLHDDHWFYDSNWLESLLDMAFKQPEIDIFGNLVPAPLGQSPNIDEAFLDWGWPFIKQANYPFFLQGLAGFHRQQVVSHFLDMGGIPGFDHDTRFASHVFERLFSYLLLDAGFQFKQLPPGFELWLSHADHIIKKKALPEAQLTKNQYFKEQFD